MWMNVQSLVFDAVPSFYAIVSTRPLDEIASEDLLKANDIGFDNMRMNLTRGTFTGPPTKQIKEFRDAVIRLKQHDRLYQQEEYGVAFIGRSLFRASIQLPANVTVGPFDTRVFLFREGELLSQYTARLNLEREGVEETLHGFALRFPLLYGLLTVLLAGSAGLAASTIFGRHSQ
ncbi:MAG: TIGR02186 family protein, partial [Steroidobacteraceae bacterium]